MVVTQGTTLMFPLNGMLNPLGVNPITTTAAPWYLAGGISAANCVAAYAPKGAADYASSKVNLANPGTYDAVDGTAYPTWNSTNGWTFIKTGLKYLSANFTAGNKSTWSVFVRYTNATPSIECLFGSLSTSGLILQSYTSNRLWGYNGSAGGGGNTLLSSGVYGIAGLVMYSNGVIASNRIPTGTGGIMPSPMGIGCLNYNGTYVQFFNGEIQAIAFYNVTINQTQVTALTSAMAAL